MNNEERKKQYKASLESDSARKKFETIETNFRTSEESLGKDLSEFTKTEIIQVINSLELITPETVRQYLNSIEGYQLFFNGEAPNITRDDIDIASSIEKNYFLSFSEIITPVMSVAPPDQGFPAAAALAFAWLGIKCPGACDIKQKEVDLLRGTICHGDIIKGFGEAEPKALAILRSYANTSIGYRRQNPRNGEFIVSFVESEYFLRPIRTLNSKKEIDRFKAKNITSAIVDARMSLRETGFQKYFSYDTVLHSGELHRVYQLEQSGVNVFAKSNTKLLCSCFASKIRDYDALFLYRKYKQAFNL